MEGRTKPNATDSPLVELLDITGALESRSLYGHEVFERVLWETVASIYVERGGHGVLDGNLHILADLPPIVAVCPLRAMAQAN